MRDSERGRPPGEGVRGGGVVAVAGSVVLFVLLELSRRPAQSWDGAEHFVHPFRDVQDVLQARSHAVQGSQDGPDVGVEFVDQVERGVEHVHDGGGVLAGDVVGEVIDQRGQVAEGRLKLAISRRPGRSILPRRSHGGNGQRAGAACSAMACIWRRIDSAATSGLRLPLGSVRVADHRPGFADQVLQPADQVGQLGPRGAERGSPSA